MIPTPAEIRELFPVTREFAYLDSAYRGPLCMPARVAAEEYLRSSSELGGQHVAPSDHKLEGARKLLG